MTDGTESYVLFYSVFPQNRDHEDQPSIKFNSNYILCTLSSPHPERSEVKYQFWHLLDINIKGKKRIKTSCGAIK